MTPLKSGARRATPCHAEAVGTAPHGTETTTNIVTKSVRKRAPKPPETEAAAIVQKLRPSRAKTSKKSAAPTPATPYAPDASKQQRILALLQRAEGATIAELQAATGWQAHSVRGFLSATVRKKLRVPLVSEMRPTGERIYRIADVSSEAAHA